MRTAAPALALALLASAPSTALAIERQLQLAARVGFAASSGTLGGLGPAADLNARYGLNDAFSLYANGSYTLAFPEIARNSPRHSGALSAGVLYAFDYLRVVPYLGLGARADLFAAPGATWWAPSAEARVGVTWLLRRTLALDFQAAYAFPFLDRDRSADLVTVTAGVMLLRDL